MAVNALAMTSGVPPSTIYSMLNEKSQNPGIVSLKKICDGLGISIREFFDCELFDTLEQEIQ
jgi:transcriptional regulator with XRE-family HTH domain